MLSRIERSIAVYNEHQSDGLDAAVSVSRTISGMFASDSILLTAHADGSLVLQNILLKIEQESHAIDDAMLLEILIDSYVELQATPFSPLLAHIIIDVGSRYYNLRKSNLIAPDGFFLLTEHSGHSPGERFEINPERMLSRKGISPELFLKPQGRSEEKISENDINQHVAWAFTNIYSVQYPGQQIKNHSGIKRYYHGIQHVARAAFYVPVLVDLYKKHGNADAANISDREIMLLQIAVLLHDAAREADGEDRWDHESAIMTYLYFVNVLGLDKSEAKKFAEAVANKDPDAGKGYFVLKDDQPDGKKIYWEWQEKRKEKNIYQKIIHDADCLDIIRVRPHFDAAYLEFYQTISKDSPEALEDMAKLITEARCLVYLQGDGMMGPDRNSITRIEKKKNYENRDSYKTTRVLVMRDSKQFPILSRKYFKNKSARAENANPFEKALRDGRVFARGITSPSRKTPKHDETAAELEIRKTLRERGISTRTLKPDRDKKQGNPARSLSMLGYGAGIFTDTGFLVTNPDMEKFTKIASVNIFSGFGKKADLKSSRRLSAKEASDALSSLSVTLKMGGSSTHYSDRVSASHNEVLYDVGKFDAIYYSEDPSHADPHQRGRMDSQLIKALYLQKVWEKKHETAFEKYLEESKEEDIREARKKFEERHGSPILPIVCYSWTRDQIEFKYDSSNMPDISDIINLWDDICSAYLNEFISKYSNDRFFERQAIQKMSIEEIKIRAVYELTDSPYIPNDFDTFVSADSVFEKSIQEEISFNVEKSRNKIFLKELEKEENLITSSRLIACLLGQTHDTGMIEGINYLAINAESVSKTHPHIFSSLQKALETVGEEPLFITIDKSFPEMTALLLEKLVQINKTARNNRLAAALVKFSESYLDRIYSELAAQTKSIESSDSNLAMSALENIGQIFQKNNLIFQYAAGKGTDRFEKIANDALKRLTDLNSTIPPARFFELLHNISSIMVGDRNAPSLELPVAQAQSGECAVTILEYMKRRASASPDAAVALMDYFSSGRKEIIQLFNGNESDAKIWIKTALLDSILACKDTEFLLDLAPAIMEYQRMNVIYLNPKEAEEITKHIYGLIENSDNKNRTRDLIRLIFVEETLKLPLATRNPGLFTDIIALHDQGNFHSMIMTLLSEEAKNIKKYNDLFSRIADIVPASETATVCTRILETLPEFSFRDSEKILMNTLAWIKKQFTPANKFSLAELGLLQKSLLKIIMEIKPENTGKGIPAILNTLECFGLEIPWLLLNDLQHKIHDIKTADAIRFFANRQKRSNFLAVIDKYEGTSPAILNLKKILLDSMLLDSGHLQSALAQFEKKLRQSEKLLFSSTEKQEKLLQTGFFSRADNLDGLKTVFAGLDDILIQSVLTTDPGEDKASWGSRPDSDMAGNWRP